MDSLQDRLSKKGWSEKEISKAIAILDSAQEKKSAKTKFLDELLVWVSLFVAVAGNFVLSVVIVPFLIIMSGFSLYAAIFCFGSAFGMLFTIILRNMERLEAKMHVIAGLFIPVIGLINMYIITRMSNKLIVLLELKTVEHDAILVSMVYIFAFIFPYLLLHYVGEFSRQNFQKWPHSG